MIPRITNYGDSKLLSVNTYAKKRGVRKSTGRGYVLALQPLCGNVRDWPSGPVRG